MKAVTTTITNEDVLFGPARATPIALTSVGREIRPSGVLVGVRGAVGALRSTAAGLVGGDALLEQDES